MLGGRVTTPVRSTASRPLRQPGGPCELGMSSM
jgi:hypothetical protein